ncbi:ferritin-like domain-containing protein [Sneathiella sp. HT1-7]|uniref:ferritin-like domain-containing protein n=1 Tax=Sneathiella sp. HT1-7 TaxID=2887192 RepID=UPI001D14A5A7|nr:ferritin-like domain-containing protein [Sneathiella sp. HT1-7]MCC3304886.1 ferritin-like domain-containing protein [Sneathiella sp. HT1-7]
MTTTLSDLAVAILNEPDAAQKAVKSRSAAIAWRASNGMMEVGITAPPDRPARPARPELLPPAEMPRRRGQSDTARATLLHAVQHIELNAIDLAWDMVARFTNESLPRDFYDDWVRVGDEEAKHFNLLADRIAELGFSYGDFPAHDGLWEAAMATRENLAARLAVVPMVLEARGLDVTPAMITRFGKIGDEKSVNVLNVILKDEIGHVAIGSRWFHHFCEKSGLDAQKTWQDLVQKFFKGLLKPPFNDTAREIAGLPANYYHPLSTPLPQKQTK